MQPITTRWSAFLLAAGPALAQEGDLGPAKDLAILYAGAPETERAAHYLEFLRRNFRQVDAITLDRLSVPAAAAYDVVIADWKRQYGPGRDVELDFPKLELDASFTKPLIMIGAVGGSIQHHTKLDWL